MKILKEVLTMSFLFFVLEAVACSIGFTMAYVENRIIEIFPHKNSDELREIKNIELSKLVGINHLTFAGLRSEQYDEEELEKEMKNKLKENDKELYSRLAKEFIYANFEINGNDPENFNLETTSNLDKIKNRKFQKEMKKFKVQFKTQLNGKWVYYGADYPYCVIDRYFECADHLNILYSSFEDRNWRRPSSANAK
jgi:hypothetical protein